MDVVIAESTARPAGLITTWLNGLRGVRYDPKAEAFTVVRKDGRLRWFSRFSNAWKDKDEEIITEEAHKAYVEWADREAVYPELWFWHTPGTKFGETDWLDFSDGFVSASGLIDADKEYVVEALKELGAQAGGLGVSHGFLHTGKKQGDGFRYYDRYLTFEISVLPLRRASVWTTNFSVAGKEAMMAFSKDKRSSLVTLMGEQWVAQAEKDQDTQAQALRSAGTMYKSEDEQAAEAEAARIAAEQAAAAAKAAGETPTPVGVSAEQIVLAFKAVIAEGADTKKQLAELTKVVVGMKGTLDKLGTDFDARVHEAVTAQYTSALATYGAAQRPTDSDKNILAGVGAKAGTDGSTGQSAQDFLSQIINRDLLGAASSAALNGGVGAPAVAGVSLMPVAPQAPPQIS